MTTQREVAALVAEYRAKMGIDVEEGPVSRERAALIERDLPVVRRMVACAESLSPRNRLRADLLDLARGLEERWTAQLERNWTTHGVDCLTLGEDPTGLAREHRVQVSDVGHVGYDNSDSAFSWQRRRGRLEYS